jgi:hypothetical protein
LRGSNVFANCLKAGSTADNPLEPIAAPGSSGLSYAPGADQYTYVWKTDKAWANTCRTLVVKLSDGTLARANFKFAK